MFWITLASIVVLAGAICSTRHDHGMAVVCWSIILSGSVVGYYNINPEDPTTYLLSPVFFEWLTWGGWLISMLMLIGLGVAISFSLASTHSYAQDDGPYDVMTNGD